MRLKNKDILNMPLEKMNAITESFSKVSEGKVLSKNEEVELQSQVLSFGRTLTKCSNGHIVPPEFKPVISEFEKADYDFTKLPMNLKISIDKTYEDLKMVCEKHSGEFKNTHAKLYCSIYEFFKNPLNLKFMNRIRKDPIVKEIDKSKESLNFRSVELWLADNYEESSEIFGIGSAVAGVKGAFAGLSTEITSTCVTIQGLTAVIAFLLVLLTILIVTLIVINLQYKSELADILKHLSGMNENSDDTTQSDVEYAAAKNMVLHTNPLTKNIFYKPVAGSLNTFNKITSKGYDWFNKILLDAKNKKLKKNSRENLEQSEESILATMGIPFWIIFSIIATMIFIKPAVYFVYRLKLKIYEFFNNEAEMLMVNIEDLKAQINNTTSKTEKARLQKIVDKQLRIYNNMAAIANTFYKAEQTASMDARDDIREDDNINYEEVVNNNQEETTQEISDTSYSTDTDPVKNTDNTSSNPKPTVIF
jgi:hypothetical protein